MSVVEISPEEFTSPILRYSSFTATYQTPLTLITSIRRYCGRAKAVALALYSVICPLMISAPTNTAPKNPKNITVLTRCPLLLFFDKLYRPYFLLHCVFHPLDMSRIIANILLRFLDSAFDKFSRL